MPYRQVISGRVELPWFGELVIPFQASTTFDDYEINTGQPMRFTVELPDSITDPDSIQKFMRERRDSLRAEGRRRSRAGGKLKEDRPAERDDAGRWPTAGTKFIAPRAIRSWRTPDGATRFEFDDESRRDEAAARSWPRSWSA